jgi:hypothetical protein
MANTATPSTVRVRLHFADSRYPGDRETFCDIADNGKIIAAGPLHTWAKEPGVTLGYLVNWLKTRNARIHSVVALDPTKQTLVDQLVAQPDRLPTTFAPASTDARPSPLTERVAALEALVGTLITRLAAVEARPVVVAEVKPRKERKAKDKQPLVDTPLFPTEEPVVEAEPEPVVVTTEDEKLLDLPF